MHLGAPFPDIAVTSQHGPLQLPGDIGSCWSVVLFHPEAFTPVCSTELAAIARWRHDLKPNTRFFSVTPDTPARVHEWVHHISDVTGTDVTHACIGDTDRRLRRIFFPDAGRRDLKRPRGLFVFDPRQVMVSKVILPEEVGFSITELRRLIIALSLARLGQAVVPADWTLGRPLLDRAQADVPVGADTQ